MWRRLASRRGYSPEGRTPSCRAASLGTPGETGWPPGAPSPSSTAAVTSRRRPGHVTGPDVSGGVPTGPTDVIAVHRRCRAPSGGGTFSTLLAARVPAGATAARLASGSRRLRGQLDPGHPITGSNQRNGWSLVSASPTHGTTIHWQLLVATPHAFPGK